MTVYFSLTMTVMTALILTSITSVKVSTGRMQAANAVDQALYSLFARYDRQLEEKYDLFFINAENGAGSPDIAAVVREIEDAAEYILNPEKDSFIPGNKGILNLAIEQGGLTGYTLATDAGGAPFAAQASDSVKNTAILKSISSLRDKVKGSETITSYGEEALKDTKDVSLPSLIRKSREAREEREARKRAAEEAGEPFTEEEPEIPEHFRNPLPVLDRLRRISILKAVVPEGREISKRAADTRSFVSSRHLSTGMGVIDTSNGTLKGADGLAFRAYIMGHYASFCEPSQNSQLAYQMEYILCGKKTDEKNLKETVKKLMLVREAANIACLYTDPGLSSTLSETALIIGTIMLIPEAAPLIKLLLAAGWSYAESLVDVRALLENKKIPYVKTGSTWQTDLAALAESRGNIAELTRDVPGGMTYEEFIAVLLLTAPSSKIVQRAMDMTESEIRGSGRPAFHLDSCIGAVSAEILVRSENRVTFPVEETMDYRQF